MWDEQGVKIPLIPPETGYTGKREVKIPLISA